MDVQGVKKRICRVWDQYEVPVDRKTRMVVLERMEQEVEKSRPYPVPEDEEDWVREWAVKGWLWGYREGWENKKTQGLHLEDGQVNFVFWQGTETKQGETTYLPLLRSIASLFGETLDRYSNIFVGQLRDRTYIHGITPDYFETSDEKPVTRIQIFFPVGVRHPLTDLIQNGTLSDEMARWLLKMNNIGANIIVFGGTGGGKTTLLNTLFEYTPYNERVVTVEHVRELRRTNPQTIYLETQPEVKMSALVHAAVRMQTDRIAVDFVRSEEAYDICQAWSTGHDGSMITMHGSSVDTIKDSLVDWSRGAVNGLPEQTARKMVEAVLEVAVHVGRVKNGDHIVLGIYMREQKSESWLPVWGWNGETWEERHTTLVPSLQKKEARWQEWQTRERKVYAPRKHDFAASDRPVRVSWVRLKAWLIQNMPSHTKAINAPASEEDIKWAESEMGIVFPEEVKEFYRMHDGETAGMFGGKEMLPLRYVVEEWKFWKGLLDEGEFEGVYCRPEAGIQRDWWNKKWIPLASNGGGDCFCLDLDPEKGGKVGQMIMMWHDTEERTVMAASFGDWFAGIVDKIESGVYTMDEDGCNEAFADME